MQQWEKAEEERLAAESNNLGNRLFKRIGSIHLPEGLGIAGAGARGTSPTSDDDHHHSGSRDRRSMNVSTGGGGSSHNNNNQKKVPTPTGSGGVSVFGGGGALLRGMSGRKSLGATPNEH